jgi:hypothetical protein
MAPRFFQSTIAVVYDFDGTLSPQPMQEYTVLPKIGIEPKGVLGAGEPRRARDRERHDAGVHAPHPGGAREGQDQREARRLRRHGIRIKYFSGVTTWFARMNRYVRRKSRGGVKLKHYLISAGQKEILDGASIRKHFSRIYASEYHFNHHGVATFPKLLVTDTMKTQFLFRINKGREGIGESINEHMPESERPIPFQNMIYVGDGMTDVPSMALTKKSGGHTVAVYQPSGKGREVCVKLLHAGRADFIAAADYRAGSRLSARVQLLLDAIIADIAYRREAFQCLRENRARA